MNNPRCMICINDCVNYTDDEQCPNFSECISISAYNKMIKEGNANLHKLCKKYNLKYSMLQDMLQGKMRMKYKYHIALMDFLLEKDEWLEERLVATFEAQEKTT